MIDKKLTFTDNVIKTKANFEDWKRKFGAVVFFVQQLEEQGKEVFAQIETLMTEYEHYVLEKEAQYKKLKQSMSFKKIIDLREQVAKLSQQKGETK